MWQRIKVKIPREEMDMKENTEEYILGSSEEKPKGSFNCENSNSM